jgi:ferredoxin--NADP+ reductase
VLDQTSERPVASGWLFIYERFEKVILVHGVRIESELAYREFISEELPKNDFLGQEVERKLIYYPTVTREAFVNQGRITALIESGKLCQDIGLPALTPQTDRAMICGSPAMLADTRAQLDRLGFQISPHIGHPGDYVIERAFVES